MSGADDETYRKNVRNMVFVLAAIVITIFGALFIPPYLYPAHEEFLPSAAVNSTLGFSLSIELNSTILAQGGAVNVTGQVENPTGQILNISAADRWAVDRGSLVTKPCISGWPVGIGIMTGYYTQDNFSLGTLIRQSQPLVSCPVPAGQPSSFLVQSHGSSAVVRLPGSITEWDLTTTFAFRGPLRGVFTVVVADEWGDVVLTHFRAI